MKQLSEHTFCSLFGRFHFQILVTFSSSSLSLKKKKVPLNKNLCLMTVMYHVNYTACSLTAHTQPNHQRSWATCSAYSQQRVSVLKVSMSPLYLSTGCGILVINIKQAKSCCFTVICHHKEDISHNLQTTRQTLSKTGNLKVTSIKMN